MSPEWHCYGHRVQVVAEAQRGDVEKGSLRCCYEGERGKELELGVLVADDTNGYVNADDDVSDMDVVRPALDDAGHHGTTGLPPW